MLIIIMYIPIFLNLKFLDDLPPQKKIYIRFLKVISEYVGFLYFYFYNF